MKLKVIQTGSAGNSYLLRSTSGECLILDCGVVINEFKQSLDFDFSNVAGALCSHSHLDHSKGVNSLMSLGVDVYALYETHKALDTISSHRAKTFQEIEGILKPVNIGGFKVLPFRVKHDVPCAGFLIEHKECGKVLFLTDTYYCPYVFKGLNNVIIEANYSKKVIDDKYGEDSDKYFLRNRILSSHFSFENCLDLLKANDLSAVNNIVLIHLSDTNSDERYFKQETEKQTGKNVTVARNGIEIEFNKTPF